MKSRVTLLFGIFLLLMQSSGQAGSGWTDYVPVAELVPTARHYYEVRLPVKVNPSGCSKTTWFYQYFNLTGSDQMFDTLLEGLRSRHRVRLYVTGKCNVNGYAEFTAVGIIP